MNDRLVAEIDLSAVRHNVAVIREFVGPRVDVMAVVKADGYGHGAAEVAQAALKAGAAWLGVATAMEGFALHRAFPAARICLLSPFAADECEDIVAGGLTPFVSDIAGLSRLEAAADEQGVIAACHLEIDTGIGRSGVQPDRVAQASRFASRCTCIAITGIATHFASAEEDPEFTAGQLAAFEQARKIVARSHRIEVTHAANSAATILNPAARYNMVRPGLLVYGILPPMPEGVASPPVRPAMKLSSQITLIRELPAGHGVSYNQTHILRRKSMVATVPVGYGDGYPRGLSNVGWMLIRGRRAPILGRVCMDVTVVDVTDIPEARTGDEVVLIGRQGDEAIRVEELAHLAETTEHEVTTRLTARVRRDYVGRGS